MLNKIIHLPVGPLSTNCWIYPINETEAAVIDPGDEADMIITALKKANLSLKYILLTHGHFDHIAAVPQLKAAFSDKLQIAIHQLDSDYLGKDSYKMHANSIKSAMGSTAFIDSFWHDMPEPDIIIEDSDIIGSLNVLHVPGHTQGSVAYLDKENGIIFTGDTLFKRGYGRTDLPGGNEKQLFESLDRLQTLDPNTKVCPGHGGTTTIDREK